MLKVLDFFDPLRLCRILANDFPTLTVFFFQKKFNFRRGRLNGTWPYSGSQGGPKNVCALTCGKGGNTPIFFRANARPIF